MSNYVPMNAAEVDWKDLTLGDVLTLQRGFDITKKEQRPGRVPVVSSSGVSSTHDTAKVDGPGVVVGRKGSLGTTYYLKEPFWPHDTTLWVKDFKGNDPYFCYLLLKTLNLAELDAGSSNPTLNRNHAHLLAVRRPPPATQARIGSMLAAFDELIEINERRIEVLEDLARSLYREWFVRFRFPGHENVDLVDSELGQIPEGWSARSTAEIFAINPRIKTNQSTFRKVTMGDVSQRLSVVSPSETATKASGTKFLRDDVLLARITPCLENGKTALVKFLEPGEVGIGSTEFIVLRGAVVGPGFTYCTARSDRLRDHAIKSMSGASGRQRVSTDALKDLVSIEPPQALADQFEVAVGPMLEEVFALYESNEALAQTRDLVLPRLVTGQLDISNIDLGVLTPPVPA